MDGVSLASVDATTALRRRAFIHDGDGLAQQHDSIEVSKTVSADVDANAPAGTINLRTKRAFDPRGAPRFVAD